MLKAEVTIVYCTPLTVFSKLKRAEYMLNHTQAAIKWMWEEGTQISEGVLTSAEQEGDSGGLFTTLSTLQIKVMIQGLGQRKEYVGLLNC